MVDDGSRDDTVGEARRAGARVIGAAAQPGQGRGAAGGARGRPRRGHRAARRRRAGPPRRDPPPARRPPGPDVHMVVGSRFLGALSPRRHHPAEPRGQPRAHGPAQRALRRAHHRLPGGLSRAAARGPGAHDPGVAGLRHRDRDAHADPRAGRPRGGGGGHPRGPRPRPQRAQRGARRHAHPAAHPAAPRALRWRRDDPARRGPARAWQRSSGPSPPPSAARTDPPPARAAPGPHPGDRRAPRVLVPRRAHGHPRDAALRRPAPPRRRGAAARLQLLRGARDGPPRAGLRPAFVDVRGPHGEMCPALAAAALSPRTRAVLLGHFFGRPNDLPRWRAFADAHGLALLEDAAHAFGAFVGGRSRGPLGPRRCVQPLAHQGPHRGHGRRGDHRRRRRRRVAPRAGGRVADAPAGGGAARAALGPGRHRDVR